MLRFREFLFSISALFTNLFQHPDWHNIIDVAILAVLIYNIIKLVMHTRSNSLMKGIVLVLVMAWVCSVLRLNAVSWLLNQIISMGLLVLVILFQPELRRGLDQLGRSKLMRRVFGMSASRESAEKVDEPVAEIVRAMADMARKKIGALIVSEETGIMSMAREGRLTRHMDTRSLTILLTELFTPDQSMSTWLGMLRREEREHEA